MVEECLPCKVMLILEIQETSKNPVLGIPETVYRHDTKLAALLASSVMPSQEQQELQDLRQQHSSGDSKTLILGESTGWRRWRVKNLGYLQVAF